MKPTDLKFNRKEDRKNWKPLRTFKEMAEEFGVEKLDFMRLMNHQHAPKPVTMQGKRTAGTLNRWYDPDEMRKWWADLKNKGKA